MYVRRYVHYLCTETVHTVISLFADRAACCCWFSWFLKVELSLPAMYCALSSFVKTLLSLAKRQCVLKSPLGKTPTHGSSWSQSVYHSTVAASLEIHSLNVVSSDVLDLCASLCWTNSDDRRLFGRLVVCVCVCVRVCMIIPRGQSTYVKDKNQRCLHCGGT